MGSTAYSVGPVTFYGPEYNAQPLILKEATRFHERHHKFHQFKMNPFDQWAREIDAWRADKKWLEVKKAAMGTTCSRADSEEIDRRIREIDDALANDAANLNRVTGQATSTMTVITRADGSLVTAFPGMP